jgi:hypothetical protein
MNLVKVLKDAVVGGAPVEAARRAVEKAEAALGVEQKRVETASVEVKGLTAKLDEADPDSRAFAALAQNVGAARAKLEALVKRRDRAAAELEDARKVLAEAERAAKLAEKNQLEVEIAEVSTALNAYAQTFARTLEARIGKLRELKQRESELAQELGEAPSLGAASSPWLALGRPLQIADEIVTKSGSAPVVGAPWDDPNASPASWGFRS